MAANISGLHVFANDVGPIPLKLLDDSFSTLALTLNTLSTFSNFFQDQGTTNAYTIQTLQHQLVSYADGLQVTVRIANTNTGMSTLNVNGLGAQHIVTAIGTELQPNALVAGSIVTFIYNAQRQAWQISDSGASGQITAPLHITNPTGQAALSINVDGSGYLGDFNGNGLSWDGACHFTFEGGATLSGIQPDFRINSLVSGYTNEPQLELRADGYSGITAWPSGTALNLEADGGGALGTPPCQLEWDANCNWIFGGDSKVTIPNVALGTAPNQILIDSNGTLTTTGTATLPMPPLIDLPGITITNPQNGEALVYDQATNSWVNGAPVNALAALNDVTLTTPATGQTLTYNAVTQRWINSPPVLALEGLTNTHISGPAPGQVLTYSINPQPGWVNATIPGYNFLTNLGVGANPQPGWVLTWDGQAWVGASPGQVATFPLSSLTDVGITTPLNRQVLTYDAPSGKWINAPAPSPSLATLPDVSLTAQSQGQVLAWDNTLHRWINSSLPGGSVIALDTLMDVNVSDPQDNQVLTWDYASARWVNRALPTTPALAALPDVTLTSAASGDLLTYNGTHWVNSGNAVIRGTAGSNALQVNSPVGAVAVFNSTAAGGTYLTWQVNSAAIGDIGSAAGNIGSGTASDMSINSRSGSLILATGNGNRLNINNSGNVIVNAPSGGSTLAAYSLTGQPAIIAGVVGATNNPRLLVTSTEATGITRLDASGSNVVANSGMELATYSAPRVFINQIGNVTINTPAGGNALTVNGATVVNAPLGFLLNIANTQPAAIGNIAALRMGVVNNFSGIEYASIQAICENAGNPQVGLGLYTNPATSNAGTERIRISGFGNVTVHPPDSGVAFTANGAVNNSTMLVSAGWNTSPGAWAAQILDVSSNTNCSNGLYIRAGTPGGVDTALHVYTANNTQMMRITGDGVSVGPFPNCMYFAGAGVGGFYGLNQNANTNQTLLIKSTFANATQQVLSCTNSNNTGLFSVRSDGPVWIGFPGSAAGTPAVFASGYIQMQSSSARFKSGVRSVQRSRARKIISKLRTISFHSRCENDDPKVMHYGLIAEEVAAVAPNLVSYDEESKPLGVQYDEIAMLLLPLVQELLGMDEPEGEVYG